MMQQVLLQFCSVRTDSDSLQGFAAIPSSTALSVVLYRDVLCGLKLDTNCSALQFSGAAILHYHMGITYQNPSVYSANET